MKIVLSTISIILLITSGCASGGSGSGLNACEGTAELSAKPGEGCGDCGTYECDGIDALKCNDPGANDCNGCSELPHEIGEYCGSCKTYVCDGPENVKCEDTGPNDCGGCDELPHAIGDLCGNCGVYQCDGQNSTQCVEMSPNDCGGCGILPHSIGDACGDCGEYICNPQDNNDVICNEMPNECGGCATLTGSVNDTCGDCGTLQCDPNNDDLLMCDDTGFNSCGGCTILEGNAQDPCACGEGTWSCNGNDAIECTMTSSPDGFDNRTDLGNFDDSDDNIYSHLGTLDPTYDTEDWYQSFANDTIWGDMDIRAWLENIPAGNNYDLCVYYDPGVDTEMTCVSGVASTYNGLNGCCSAQTSNTSEHVELNGNALGTTDEDGYFYYRVYYTFGPGSCDQYSLNYAF